MKRLLVGLVLLSGMALLGGCPVYSSASDYPVCGANGKCFDCPSGSTPSGGTCIPWQCSLSSDCPQGYQCTANACAPLSDASDCSGGCPADYICKLSARRTQCVPVTSLSNDAGLAPGDNAASSAVDSPVGDAVSTGPGDARGLTQDATAGADTASAVDGADAFDAADALDAASAFDSPRTGEAFDAASALDSSGAFAFDATGPGDVVSALDASEEAAALNGSETSVQGLCNANADCGGGGAKCIDGQCTAQGRLCSDSTQCFVATNSCVDGVCEPRCSANNPCPSGYACDFNRGVCNVNSNPCGGFGQANCQGGSTCVEGRCVAPCFEGDGAGVCPGGQLCVHGGCIPDEAARFECKNDGEMGPLATACIATAICIHHDCYAACDPDAGAAACSDPGAVCKEVTVTAGTYVVCGTAANLGSDCDPAAGKYCAGAVCIDGHCK